MLSRESVCVCVTLMRPLPANKPGTCWHQHRILKGAITFITPSGLEIVAGQLLCSGFWNRAGFEWLTLEMNTFTHILCVKSRTVFSH